MSYQQMNRRRINANPARSLRVLQTLKDESLFGFGVTVQALATRLLAMDISGPTVFDPDTGRLVWSSRNP